MSLDRFVRAADAAACDTLGQLGPSLVNLGVWTMWTPKVGLTAMTLGAASNLAYQYGCAEFDAGVSPNSDTQRGCQQLTAGLGDLRVFDSSGTQITTLISDITGYTQSAPYEGPVGTVQNYTFQRVIGGPYGEPTVYGIGSGDYVEMVLQTGAVCGTDVVPLPPVPPTTDPFDFTDPVTNCELTLNFQGFAQLAEGNTPQPVYLIQNSTNLLRSGGRIGGCLINPTIYYGGPNGDGGGGNGGGDGVTLPVPPGPLPPFGPEGEPWWADLLQAALGGLAALTADRILDGLFQSTYPGLIYRMVSVCETDSGGEPISESVDVPIPALTAPDAQLARLDAIVELLQAAKNFKQPVCPPERPELLGDWVTVRFESLEISPQGTRPLRKLFRYRSQSALDLGQIAAYWENFQWNAGPVCVQHKGAWWGTPQCWASNAEEGKRVIRFAGLEAGIDPDVIGEWVISGSSDPRFGMPGTMQVAKVQGLEWVTSRQGPSGLPLLTVDP